MFSFLLNFICIGHLTSCLFQAISDVYFNLKKKVKRRFETRFIALSMILLSGSMANADAFGKRGLHYCSPTFKGYHFRTSCFLAIKPIQR